MNEYNLEVKIICQNHIIKGGAKATEGHPWRNWRVRLMALENQKEKKGKLNFILDHVEYNLHPTFETPKRVVTKEPYYIQEKGWGEFDMSIELFFKNNMYPSQIILFDLHFREPTYTIIRQIQFENPSAEFIQLLNSPVPLHEYAVLPSLSHEPSTRKRRTSPTLLSTSATTKKVKSPSSNDHGTHLNEDKKEGIIVDDIYDEKDIQKVSSIHSTLLDEKTRQAWGIPKGLDILELARRLSALTPEQAQDMELIILNNKKEDMLLEDNDEEFVVDLYSLGANVLNLLWDFTEKVSTQGSSVISPFSLVQANTNLYDEDM